MMRCLKFAAIPAVVIMWGVFVACHVITYS